MINYKKALLSNIDKISSELKSEEELEFVLKKRLTKKEFKVFCAKEQDKSDEEAAELANCEPKRAVELYKNAVKKINQERIKQEFVN